MTAPAATRICAALDCDNPLPEYRPGLVHPRRKHCHLNCESRMRYWRSQSATKPSHCARADCGREIPPLRRFKSNTIHCSAACWQADYLGSRQAAGGCKRPGCDNRVEGRVRLYCSRQCLREYQYALRREFGAYLIPNPRRATGEPHGCPKCGGEMAHADDFVICLDCGHSVEKRVAA